MEVHRSQLLWKVLRFRMWNIFNPVVLMISFISYWPEDQIRELYTENVCPWNRMVLNRERGKPRMHGLGAAAWGITATDIDEWRTLLELNYGRRYELLKVMYVNDRLWFSSYKNERRTMMIVLLEKPERPETIINTSNPFKRTNPQWTNQNRPYFVSQWKLILISRIFSSQ